MIYSFSRNKKLPVFLLCLVFLSGCNSKNSTTSRTSNNSAKSVQSELYINGRSCSCISGRSQSSGQEICVLTGPNGQAIGGIPNDVVGNCQSRCAELLASNSSYQSLCPSLNVPEPKYPNGITYNPYFDAIVEKITGSPPPTSPVPSDTDETITPVETCRAGSATCNGFTTEFIRDNPNSGAILCHVESTSQWPGYGHRIGYTFSKDSDGSYTVCIVEPQDPSSTTRTCFARQLNPVPDMSNLAVFQAVNGLCEQSLATEGSLVPKPLPPGEEPPRLGPAICSEHNSDIRECQSCCDSAADSFNDQEMRPFQKLYREKYRESCKKTCSEIGDIKI